MSRAVPLVIVAVFLVGAFAGCLSSTPTSDNQRQADAKKIQANTAQARAVAEGAYRFDGSYSYTLVNGTYEFDPSTPLGQGKLVTIPSKFLMSGQDVSITAPTEGITLGLWLPKLGPGEKAPVIVDAGPYFGSGDPPVDKPANRLGKWAIENFVPYGYAVAQLAVRGTGNSGGCMDLMGAAEQQDIATAIEWLGSQSWSNGNVGMIGRSYDGSTPWEAAAQNAPHLKTIVPISGLSDFFGLMTHNGTSESRALVLIHAIYYAESYSSVGRDQTNIATAPICPEAFRGFATAAASVVTGSRTPAVNDYYYVRNFQQFAREKWRGSVFIIHGLQDWNVEPHMAAPLANDMEAQGYFVHQLWGQWDHSYPDRNSEHVGSNPANPRLPCGASLNRWDWAEMMLRWFDHELKGLPVELGAPVQIQDSMCQWHIEDHYPPHDATWTTLHLSSGNKLSPEPGAAGSNPITPAGQLTGDQARGLPGYSVDFSTAPYPNGVKFSGLPRLHITVTPSTATGNVGAYMYDVGPDQKEKLVGWTEMDIRYYNGGDDMGTIVPGQPILMKMQFEPLDVAIPPEHRIVLRLWQKDYSDHITSIPPGVVTLQYGGSTKSVLELPVIERGPDSYFLPPQPPEVKGSTSNAPPT